MIKLLGYDYEIIYKAGQENKVADALSRQEWEGNCSTIAITVVQTDWLIALKQSWSIDPELQTIIIDLINDPTSHGDYSWHHNLLTYKGKLVVSSEGNVKTQILHELHSSPIGGHSGIEDLQKG